MKFRFLFIAFFGFAVPMAAQQVPDPGPGFYDMTLEQLMNVEVTVASRGAETPRNSPGIVTLITSEEIASSGARDMMDVLRLIPGFNFGVDVEGVVGIGVRGNWAHEGKILLLIDGVEMNENLYSTIQFGNHYPVQNISRIEIMRGPGSAMYGGNAEYAVINIITAPPECRKGTKITTSYGQMEKTFGRRNLSICTGAQRSDFGYSVSLFAGEANRSDHLYSDLWGNSYNMAGHSKITSAHLNVGMNYKNFNFRGIADRYTVFTRDNYDLITSKAYPVRFDTYVADLSKEITISPLFKLTPRVSYKLQLPWYFKGTVNNDEFKQFEVSSARLTSGVISSWDPVKQFRLTTGLEFFYDEAKQLGDDFFVSNGSKRFHYNNTSFFTEGNLKSRIVNINVGARYSNSNWSAPSFVPRISLTKTIDRFHVKALYSQAYRAPNTENMDLNPEIQFETTTVVEFETGYMFSDKIYLTGNIYDIRTSNPIIYSYDLATDQDEYINSEKTGTQGVEFDFRIKLKKFFVNLGYAFYSAENLERLDVYEVSTNRSALLGLPNQKISLNAGIKIKRNISLNTSAIWSGIKYGVVSLDDAGNSTIGKYNPLLLWNFSVKYENIFLDNLSASFGVFNILNGIEYYVQPYNSGHGALPGPSREIVFSLSYKITHR